MGAKQSHDQCEHHLAPIIYDRSRTTSGGEDNFLIPEAIAIIVSFLHDPKKRDKKADIYRQDVLHFSFCNKWIYNAIHYGEYLNEFWKHNLMKYFSFTRWNRSLNLVMDYDSMMLAMMDEYTREVHRIKASNNTDGSPCGYMPPLSWFFQYQIDQLKLIKGCIASRDIAVLLVGSSVETDILAMNCLMTMTHKQTQQIRKEESDWHPMALQLKQLFTRVFSLPVNNKWYLVMRMERYDFSYKYRTIRGLQITGIIYGDRSEDTISNQQWDASQLRLSHANHPDLLYWMLSTEPGDQQISRSQLVQEKKGIVAARKQDNIVREWLINRPPPSGFLPIGRTWF